MKKERLLKFSEGVIKGRLVQFWSNLDDLSGKVAVSLIKVIKRQPVVGWVREKALSKLDQIPLLFFTI